MWRIGKISQFLFPGYGACKKCQTSWRLVEGHTVWYEPHMGIFALCEACWNELTPNQRLIYYSNAFWDGNKITDCYNYRLYTTMELAMQYVSLRDKILAGVDR